MHALGYIFRRKGKDELTGKEIVLSASMDLGWFSPKEAQKLLDVSKELRLLTETEEGFKPSFDYKGLDIPLEFKPTERVLKIETQEPLFIAIVRKAAEKSCKNRNDIIAQVNRKKEELSIDIEVAALLVAAQYDVSVTEFLDEAQNEIFNRVE
jgi:hypothetical protein